MYLFFDTETTGLPKNWKAPVHDLSNWPRLVQLAYLLYDNSGNLVLSADRIVKPEDFVVPVSASAIHGITHERACAEGSPLSEVLGEFFSYLEKSKTLDMNQLIQDVVNGKMSLDIYKEAKMIYPLRRVEVRKTEIRTEPAITTAAPAAPSASS